MSFFLMFFFVYMLHEGLLVVYTLASALLKLDVRLFWFGGFTGSAGLTGLGTALVGLTVVAVGLAGVAVVVVVVIMLVAVVVGLVAEFTELETEVGLAGRGAGLAGATGLVVFMGAGLAGLVGLAGAGLVGLVGLAGAWLAGLDSVAVLVSTCCSGPFSWRRLTTAGGWNIIRSRWGRDATNK